MTTQNAIALTGLPGAGKSHGAEMIADVFEIPKISMGDAIRDEFEERNPGEDADSKALADFAASWREEAAKEIPEKVAELASRHDSGLVVIDGVRSPTDYHVLDDEFEYFFLINVVANFRERLDRLTNRGREGEEDFDRLDLADRDLNELDNLGQRQLRNEELYDVEVKNNGEKSVFYYNLGMALLKKVQFVDPDSSVELMVSY